MVAWCLRPALATHRGQRRPHNEDAIGYTYPIDLDRLKAYGALFIVADGVGGLQDGQNASHLTVNGLSEMYYNTTPDQAIEDRLRTLIQQLNERVYSQLPTQSATTLVAAVFHADDVVIAHVGDSRAYWVTPSGIVQLTEDHSVAITKPDGKVKHKLERAIGYRSRVQVDIQRHPAPEGQTLLILTDGATRYLQPHTLQQIVIGHPPTEAISAIIHQAYQAGGVDNISAAVIQVLPGCNDDQQVQHHINQLNKTPVIHHLPDNLSPPPARVASPPPITAGDAPQAPAPRPQAPPKHRISRVAITGLIVIGLIIGAGWVALNGGRTLLTPATPTATPTPEPTITSMPTPTPTPTPTPLPPTPTDIPVIAEGRNVIFTETVLTYVRIGADVAAFALVPGQTYSVTQSFTGADGVTWYRLFDPESEQNGWIQEDELPDYQVE